MLLPNLDPDLRYEPFAQDAGPMPLPPNFFMERHFWRFNTSSNWWDQLIMELWDNQQWLYNFQIQKASFQELCACLTSVLQQQDTHQLPF